MEQIVLQNKICGPNTIRKVIETFSLNLSRKENYYIKSILRSFPEVEMFRKFKVCKYSVDLYVPKYNLVIEREKINHYNIDQKEEKDRLNFIKYVLDCKFISFNPDLKDFSIFSVISNIHKFILENEIIKLKSEIQQKDNIIKLLKNE